MSISFDFSFLSPIISFSSFSVSFSLVFLKIALAGSKYIKCRVAKMNRLYRFFFKLYQLYGFLAWKYTFFGLISANFALKFQLKNLGKMKLV